MEPTNPTPCACEQVIVQLSEIHTAILGTPEKSGIVGRLEKVESKQRTHRHIIGLTALGLLGAAGEILLKRFGT